MSDMYISESTQSFDDYKDIAHFGSLTVKEIC